MEDVAYLQRGKVRKLVLYAIKDKPKTATAISTELNKHRSSISRTLLVLESDVYAKCLNPKDDKQRYYSITPKGKRLLEKSEPYS